MCVSTRVCLISSLARWHRSGRTRPRDANLYFNVDTPARRRQFGIHRPQQWPYFRPPRHMEKTAFVPLARPAQGLQDGAARCLVYIAALADARRANPDLSPQAALAASGEQDDERLHWPQGAGPRPGTGRATQYLQDSQNTSSAALSSPSQVIPTTWPGDCPDLFLAPAIRSVVIVECCTDPGGIRYSGGTSPRTKSAITDSNLNIEIKQHLSARP